MTYGRGYPNILVTPTEDTMTPRSAEPEPVDRHALDYDLDDVVEASTNEQMKALADDTRVDILDLLLEKAATVSQLAEVLGKPKGTIGYHAKVLERAGMIRVVRTNKVRAMTEKYYGRVGRTIKFVGHVESDDPLWFVHDALRAAVIVEDGRLPMFTSRMARIPLEHAVAFSERIVELAEEFLELPRGGDTVYGFLAGVYPTDRRSFGGGDGDDS